MSIPKRAIALISGGLDSILAARLIKEQGIEVLGLSFVIGFASKENSAFERHVKKTSEENGIPHRIIDISKEFLEVLRAPRHGYGANINPCIDCKTLMLKKAKEIMEKEGYGFIVTGEVLGQRPMSQRREALNIILKDTGLKGFLLRPLTAKMLEETEPEKEGVVDRSRLLDMRGRSRKPQMELAERFGMEKFSQPAGGCLLTDPGFAARIKDLMVTGTLDMDNIALLKYGRHFRLDGRTKAVLGRDEKENDAILRLKKKDDLVFRLIEDPGPYGILRGDASEANIAMTGALVVSHSKKKTLASAEVEYWYVENEKKTAKASPLPLSKINALRI